jgi:hypothetical protein
MISGPMLDAALQDGKLRFPSSVAVTTPASAAAAVDLLKSQGVDFIKVQSVISHDAYLAAAAEAHKIEFRLSATYRQSSHQRSYCRRPEKHRASDGQLRRLLQRGRKIHSRQGNLKLLLTAMDQKKCHALIARLAQTQTWECPTLAWQRGGTFLDQRDLKHDPLDKFVPACWREVTWKRFFDAMLPDLQRDPLELRREYFARNLQMVGAQHRAGVPFLAGTDTAPAIYVLPASACMMSWRISSRQDCRRWTRCKPPPAIPQSFSGRRVRQARSNRAKSPM